MRTPPPLRLATYAAGLVLAAPSPAQDPTVEQRLRRVEEQNAELARRIASLTQELEQRDVAEPAWQQPSARLGLGPGAGKVYRRASGVSLGGYGEFLFSQISGRTDQFDALRAVLYAGYRFDDHWLVNTEIEIEHGTTEASSGTTTSEGSVSLEFGYVDHLISEGFSLRGGLLLVPSGLVNEQHEPTTFLTASRSQTESRILPTTWRELGAGAYGELGDIVYRVYATTYLDGEEFTASGLRSGRQKGNRVAADDFALLARLDWIGSHGLLLGVSATAGRTGQDGLRGTTAIPPMFTTVVDAHADWRRGPLQVRALCATAFVDDAGEFNAATAQSVASRMVGAYVEAGFDLFAAFGGPQGQALKPFLRWETIDTQEHMPGGFNASGAQEDRILTFGLDWLPLDQLVFKLDFEDWNRDPDQLHVAFGYVF